MKPDWNLQEVQMTALFQFSAQSKPHEALSYGVSRTRSVATFLCIINRLKTIIFIIVLIVITDLCYAKVAQRAALQSKGGDLWAKIDHTVINDKTAHESKENLHLHLFETRASLKGQSDYPLQSAIQMKAHQDSFHLFWLISVAAEDKTQTLNHQALHSHASHSSTFKRKAE